MGNPRYERGFSVTLHPDQLLLFFSKHPAGLTLWRNVTKVEASGQRRLF
jgi:hypothetical protein